MNALVHVAQQQVPCNVAGFNINETGSRTQLFGPNNEHGCTFCIQMHVDTLKYAEKLNNKQANKIIGQEVSIGILHIFSFPYPYIHLLAALNMMGFHPFLLHCNL